MTDLSDLGVYLVTSGAGRRTVEVAVAAARGGAGMIQVRAKDLGARDLLALVGEVATAVTAVAPVPVVVDDSVEVAWTARQQGLPVAGVHLGQDDLPVRAARALLGPEAIIGLTTGTLALVEASNEVADVVDYLGAGPFRPTPTKDSGRTPLGLAGYPPLVAATRLPIVAIGDVQPGDVTDLAATGVAAVAVVRCVMNAADPERVVRDMVGSWCSRT